MGINFTNKSYKHGFTKIIKTTIRQTDSSSKWSLSSSSRSTQNNKLNGCENRGSDSYSLSWIFIGLSKSYQANETGTFTNKGESRVAIEKDDVKWKISFSWKTNHFVQVRST